MAVALHHRPRGGGRATALSHRPRPVFGRPILNEVNRPLCLRGREKVV